MTEKNKKSTKSEGKSKPLKLTLKKRAMIKALESTLGNVTHAADEVGVCRRQHYTWMKEDPEYKALVDDVQEMALDFAESALRSQIGDDNTAATIFFLKTKGKCRGYTEEVVQNHKGTIEVEHKGQTALPVTDELRDEVNEALGE